MGFDYNNLKINILDTPGHKDFSEDTYRTLTAVDSAIMVIDGTKGVEKQTQKLMEVCRMRNTPIITFINKCDRYGKDPIELLDEIEDKLQINVIPLTWPVGAGSEFKGVYHFSTQSILLFDPHQTSKGALIIKDLNSDDAKEKIGLPLLEKLNPI